MKMIKDKMLRVGTRPPTAAKPMLAACGGKLLNYLKIIKMSRQHHYLKTETEYYQAIERGFKKFELRKNDRNFQVGDMLYLEEVVQGIKTGRSLPPLEVRYILKGGNYGLLDGHCILNW